MNEINIIMDNNRNILGVYNENSLAFLELMDLIISQLNIIFKMMKEVIDIKELNKLSNNYRIISMRINSNVIYKEYFFSLQTFSFFDNNKEIIDFFDEYNFALIKKKSHIKQLYDQILHKFSNEELPITVFIPTVKMDSDMILNNNIDTEYINNKIIESEEKLSQGKLLSKIEELKEKKKKSKINLKEMKNKNKKKKKLLLKKSRKIEDIKRKERIRQDKLKEYKRIFEADKIVYEKIKDDINDEDEIPELFKRKFEILKKMEVNNELNKEGEFDTYMKGDPMENNIKTKYDRIFNTQEGNYENFKSSSSELESESESESESETESESSSEETESENNLKNEILIK